jgi:YHS domain-containing protein
MTQITNYSFRQRARFGARRRLGGALVAVAISMVTHVLVAGTAEQIAARAPVSELNVKDGVAVKGYDPVAYFNDGKPVKGSPEHTFKWKGATWRFVSAEHRDAFMREPTKYAPQYGGYCAFGVSQSAIVDIDPNQWKIVKGRLYLNANALAQRLWAYDPEGHIKKGDAYWQVVPRRPL